jgi:hypothetical protein
MREYIQPGFAQAQKQREVEKLTAVLQALKNCHGALGTIQGGEELFLAQEDLASLFLRIDAIRMEKMSRLDSPAPSYPASIDIELEEESGLALID